MITDKVDGDIARSRNLVTNFGKIADPIADKALTGMAFVGLSIIGELWWWVTILVLVREWGITLLRLWVIRHGVMAAGRGGKLKTVLQTFALGFFILPIRILQDDWGVVGDVLWGVAVVLMVAAVTLTVVDRSGLRHQGARGPSRGPLLGRHQLAVRAGGPRAAAVTALGPLELVGRADQGEVRERLREVADEALRPDVVLLGEQARRRWAAPAAAASARARRRAARRARRPRPARTSRPGTGARRR